MSILRDFEKRLEGAVEGFFARAFRSGLQPVELAKALQRYATNYQQVGVDATYVPNVYRFSLSTTDLERFSGFTRSLQRELADVARRTADERGWRTYGPIRIEFERSDDVQVGTYELRGKAEMPDEAPRTASAATAGPGPAATVAAPTGNGRAVLRVIAGPGAGASFPIGDHAVIGRLPDCEVTVGDTSVSRRHARVQREGDRWTVADLGSTNGVLLNGSSVQMAELRDGDRLELGAVTLAFGLQGVRGGP